MRIPVSFILPPPKKIAVRIQPELHLSVPIRIEWLAAHCAPRYQSRVMLYPPRLQIKPENK